jgi:hypothetical protein
MEPNEKYRKVLDAFELQAILEYNDIEHETVLAILVEEGLLDENDLDEMCVRDWDDEDWSDPLHEEDS